MLQSFRGISVGRPFPFSFPAVPAVCTPKQASSVRSTVHIYLLGLSKRVVQVKLPGTCPGGPIPCFSAASSLLQSLQLPPPAICQNLGAVQYSMRVVMPAKGVSPFIRSCVPRYLILLNPFPWTHVSLIQTFGPGLCCQCVYSSVYL